jgi:hypothetical protein
MMGVAWMRETHVTIKAGHLQIIIKHYKKNPSTTIHT